MTNRLLAFTALFLVLGVEARADDLSALKQQQAALKKQNIALIRRLEKFEKRQAVQQAPAPTPGRLRPAPPLPKATSSRPPTFRRAS